MWGPTERLEWDIQSALCEAAPEYSWTVLNDVTAAAVGLASTPKHRTARRLAVLTVSSGIALRTIEPGTGRVTPSVHSGLQGEVGHLPASFTYGGRTVSRLCACGTRDHLSAFSSGQAIVGLLGELRDAGCTWLAGVAPTIELFASAISTGNAEAIELLAAITRPLADTLLAVLSIDGAIDRVVVTGGVVEGLAPGFFASLLDDMASVGLYGSHCRAAADFARLVHPETNGSALALTGAALSAGATRSDQSTSVVVGARLRSSPGHPSRPSDRRWHVRAEQARSYDILLSDEVLQPSNPALAELAGILHLPRLPQLLVADRAAWRHHGGAITEYFLAYGQEPRVMLLAASEGSKDLRAVLDVLDECLARSQPRRQPPIVAIGGGVVLDIVGLAANLFRRGVPYVRLPTTLLAMIDAAIGVKTAVNYHGRKSAIGTYYPPDGVLVDPSFLTTLSRRDLASGLAEAIKIAVVADAALFELLVTQSATLSEAMDCMNVRELIAGCITALLPELACNLWETQLERLADFGHSFSPALEMAGAGRLLHGEGVALDMALSIELAEGRGYIDSDTGARIRGLLRDFGLPLLDDLMTEERLWRGLCETTRHRGDLQRIPLPVAIGRAVFVSDIDREELARALARLGRHQAEAHA